MNGLIQALVLIAIRWIVDRDLKPDNVQRDLKPAKPKPFRTPRGDPPVYCFDANRYRTEGQVAGIAKIAAEDPPW